MAQRIEELTRRICDVAPMHLLKDASVAGQLARRWTERHRGWHGPEHLLALLSQFESELNSESREILLLASLYHDAIYDPRRLDNEEASAQLLQEHAGDKANPFVRRATELVLASKWNVVPDDPLIWRFWEADCSPLFPDYPLAKRLSYERSVFREYQFAPWPIYRSKRAEFLREWADRFPQHRGGVEACLGILDGLTPRVAIYPGSFNPFHRGHLSVLRHAERVFDKVVIGVAANRQKSGATASLKNRSAELQARLCFHEVAEVTGLLTSFLAEFPLPLSVVRGVRDGTDLEAELRYARFLNELLPDTSVVWIGCEAEMQHLSSSAIRELDSIEAHAGNRYVPSTSEIYGLIRD